jgi:hypothetical protein
MFGRTPCIGDRSIARPPATVNDTKVQTYIHAQRQIRTCEPRIRAKSVVRTLSYVTIVLGHLLFSKRHVTTKATSHCTKGNARGYICTADGRRTSPPLSSQWLTVWERRSWAQARTPLADQYSPESAVWKCSPLAVWAYGIALVRRL